MKLAITTQNFIFRLDTKTQTIISSIPIRYTRCLRVNKIIIYETSDVDE